MIVDLGALRQNYRFFQREVAPATVAAAVKADAYGIGMPPVAEALWEEGCRTFFVAFLEEGLLLHRLLPQAVIYILEGLQEGQQEAFVQPNLRPVLGDRRSIELWCSQGASRPCALHIDTGMARTGLEVKEVDGLTEAIRLLKNVLVMTHYASSDHPTSSQNQGQRDQFVDLAARLFPGAQTCLANSHGVFLGANYRGDMVRVGMGLSGLIDPSFHQGQLAPAVEVRAKITQLRTIEAGQRVGYKGTWEAPHTTHLATLGMGYADGVPHSLSNKGAFFHGETLFPIVGAVSMDFTTVDVTKAACNTLKVGGELTFFKDSTSLAWQAKQAGTIGYEMLVRLGQRCQRIYRE